MIELELFYERSMNAIRTVQAEYLKKQKSVPFEQDLPEVSQIEADELAKMRFWERVRYYIYIRKAKKQYKKALKRQKRPMDEVLTQGYNAGIEKALSVLGREYEAFKKKIEKEEN